MPDGRVYEAAVRVPAEQTASSTVARLPCELLADVLLLGKVGSRTEYSYRVPDRLSDVIGPGHLVQVPFGARVLQGLVLTVDRAHADGIRLRDITGTMDPRPCLTQTQIQLARWIAEYYACSLAAAVDAMLPRGLDRAEETVYSAVSSHESALGLSARQGDLLATLLARGPSGLASLSAESTAAATSRALQALVRQGLVVRTARLGRAAVVDAVESLVSLRPGPAVAATLTDRQRDIVEYIASGGGQVLYDDLRHDLGTDRAAISRLEKRGVVVLSQRRVRRDPFAHRSVPPNYPLTLTRDQQAVFDPIAESLARRDGAVFLLHGVTGSGKTEIYLRAVADTLASDRQAIVLVPEIGLTPQTVTRFAGRFPGSVALLHSRLTDGQRFDEWQRIRQGECSVAVGPRSAIFSPFGRLGLVVLDEEHDASYKQDGTQPRYHTRDVAEQLARLTGATVVLGSATPDVCSYHSAQSGRYRLLSLTQRVAAATTADPGGSVSILPHRASSTATEGQGASTSLAAGLPAVQVVDMRLELKAGNRSIFSRALASALGSALDRHEQAILFLNRRGHATFINCRDCGHVVKCHHCDVPMSYHSQGERLLCHRCNARAALPSVCGACGSWRIRYFGIGTQRVEQELRKRFPGARAQRYDRDVTSGRLGHEKILDRFAAGDIDVLVGTQIVAKGLDFPRVTVVGAVSADTSLNLPDFRAAERTFSLLTQVSGRAGRAELPGVVVVQTYTPDHFAIAAAAEHDYLAFYRDELRYRRESGYPPFRRLARLVKSGPSDSACREEALALAERLQSWELERAGAAVAAIEILRASSLFHRQGRRPFLLADIAARQRRSPDSDRGTARMGYRRRSHEPAVIAG